jgi:hypothetical protein
VVWDRIWLPPRGFLFTREEGQYSNENERWEEKPKEELVKATPDRAEDILVRLDNIIETLRRMEKRRKK